MHDPLSRQLNQIELPPQLHARCMQGVHCAQQNKEDTMNNTANHKNVRFPARRIIAVAAAVVVCTAMLGGTAMADSVKGFFADVTRWDGAVTGTEYHATAQEVTVTAQNPSAEGDALLLPVDVEFADPAAAPFAFLDELTLEDCALQNEAGENVAVRMEVVPAALQDGCARIMLRLPADLPGGRYTLIVRSFSGSAKADQPLPIYGQWNCDFTVG